MARDYAKPRNPNAGRNGGGRGGNAAGNNRRGGGGNNGGGGSGGSLPGWVWMIVGLAIGLVVAAFVYIDRPQHKTRLGEAAQAEGDLKPLLGDDGDKPAPKAAKPVARDDGNGKGKTAKPADSVPVPSPDKVPPRYTFYNELPKIEVAIPREYSRPAQAAAPGKPAPAPVKPPPAEVKQALAAPGAYLIQVGAYKSREEADRQRAKLALIGYESRIEQVTLSERDVRFRVRVGPQASLSAAQDVLARLESNSISGFLVKIKD